VRSFPSTSPASPGQAKTDLPKRGFASKGGHRRTAPDKSSEVFPVYLFGGPPVGRKADLPTGVLRRRGSGGPHHDQVGVRSFPSTSSAGPPGRRKADLPKRRSCHVGRGASIFGLRGKVFPLYLSRASSASRKADLPHSAHAWKSLVPGVRRSPHASLICRSACVINPPHAVCAWGNLPHASLISRSACVINPSQRVCPGIYNIGHIGARPRATPYFCAVLFKGCGPRTLPRIALCSLGRVRAEDPSPRGFW